MGPRVRSQAPPSSSPCFSSFNFVSNLFGITVVARIKDTGGDEEAGGDDSDDGEAVCEDRGFTETECEDMGCCQWEDGDCWSAVGDSSCFARRRLSTSHDKSQFQHATKITAGWLDNDGDGSCDDPRVCRELKRNGATLMLFKDEGAADSLFDFGWGMDSALLYNLINIELNGLWLQDLYFDEIHADSCAFVETEDHNSTCSSHFDATLEEVLHLVTGAGASRVYGDFAESKHSKLGRLLEGLNGNCGWGFSGDWRDPSGGNCTGFYAYDDETCDFSCIVTEGLYWGLTSLLGAQDYRSVSRRSLPSSMPSDAAALLRPSQFSTKCDRERVAFAQPQSYAS